MCWQCDMFDAVARREWDPNRRAMADRGEEQIRAYMDAHGVAYGQAVEALGAQRRQQFAELTATYAELHGLDDEQVMFALWAHGIDGPGGVQ